MNGSWHSARRFLLIGLVVLLAGCAGKTSPDSAVSVIAFGSCSNQRHPQPIWAAVARSQPDLLIMLGDNVYADTEDMAKMRQCYDKLDADPGFATVRRSTRILATWDDHDYGANDAGAEYPRRDEAQKEFLRFFKEPKNSPRWKRPGVYEAYLFGPPGQRVQVIMLDTRYFRSPLKPKYPDRPTMTRYAPNTDPGATVLGEAQWTWLEEQLRIPAEVRIIGSSIQLLADQHDSEKWGNFPLEQERLLRLLRQTKAEGVVVLSGDRHRAEISRADDRIGYPLFDLTSSGFNRHSSATAYDEPNRYRLGPNYIFHNFGLITIDWTADRPSLLMQIRDDEGKTILEQKVLLSELRNKP